MTLTSSFHFLPRSTSWSSTTLIAPYIPHRNYTSATPTHGRSIRAAPTRHRWRGRCCQRRWVVCVCVAHVTLHWFAGMPRAPHGWTVSAHAHMVARVLCTDMVSAVRAGMHVCSLFFALHIYCPGPRLLAVRWGVAQLTRWCRWTHVCSCRVRGAFLVFHAWQLDSCHPNQHRQPRYGFALLPLLAPVLSRASGVCYHLSLVLLRLYTHMVACAR